MKTQTHESFIVPAGTYWLGDPCYSIPKSEWREWLEAANYTTTENLEASLGTGKYAIGLHTAYGDGLYEGTKGRRFAVDSGLIGLVDVRWAPDLKIEPPIRVQVMFGQDT